MSLGLLGEAAPDLTRQELDTKMPGEGKGAHREQVLSFVCLTPDMPGIPLDYKAAT